MTKGEQKTGHYGNGEAYGFFNSRASLKKLNDNMSDIREGPCIKGTYKIPGEVKLELKEVKDVVSDRNTPSGLIEFINEADIIHPITKEKIYVRDMKYVLKATYASRTNDDAARELKQALDTIDYLTINPKDFVGAIAGADADGRYCFWEEEMRKAV